MVQKRPFVIPNYGRVSHKPRRWCCPPSLLGSLAVLAHRPRPPHKPWRPDRCCTNIHCGPLGGGRSGLRRTTMADHERPDARQRRLPLIGTAAARHQVLSAARMRHGMGCLFIMAAAAVPVAFFLAVMIGNFATLVV